MSAATLYRKSGRAVQLGPVLGRGGEGEVREVAGEPTLVAKIYLEAPESDRIDKLVAMVALSDPAIIKIAAWPLDTLHERPGGDVVGFLMPKVAGRLELHKLAHPLDRFRHFADVGYDFLVHVATNVARAFQVLHEHGLVIGDVNESGLMVGRDGTVMLIDTDSMQLRTDDGLYTCDVGKPEFQPPELLLGSQSFRGLKRKVDHDAFGLAVLVFQLLFFGWHPFNVRMLVGDQEPIPDNIKKARYPYLRGFQAPDFVRPPHALAPEVLPAWLRELFDRAFAPGGHARPSAETWVSGLVRFASESKSCPRFGTHWYHASHLQCPLCDLDERLGFAILPHIALDAAQLRAIWSQVQAAYFELGTPLVPEEPTVLAAQPVPADLVVAARRNVRLTWAQLALVAGAALLPLSLAFVALPALALPLELVIRMTRPRRAALRHQRQLVRAKAAALADLRSPQAAAISHNYDAAAADYQRIVRFEDHRQEVVGALHQRAFPEQIQRYLAGLPIEADMPPGVMDEDVAALERVGIRSAADLMHGVPGARQLDPGLVELLERWVRYAESRFVPDLDDKHLRGVVRERGLALDHEYAALVERLKVSHEWLSEQLPIERRRRAAALAAYLDAARALAEHLPIVRVARARFALIKRREIGHMGASGGREP